MALTTVYTTDVDISVVIFIVETIITAILFIIKLLKPERELREVFEYRTVKNRGYVPIRGHSYVKPPFLTHLFTLGFGYASLLLMVIVGMMGCGMIGAFVATDSEEVLFESRNWRTCRDWVAEDPSNRLLEGMNFANFVCGNFSGSESSGVFFDAEGLRCSDSKFEPGSEHCTVLRETSAIADNCDENSRLRAVYEALNRGDLFRLTELRSWIASTLLTPQFSKVWAEFGTNTTILGKELVIICSLQGDFANLNNGLLLSDDFSECFFVTDGVYFFTTGSSDFPETVVAFGREVNSIEEKIQELLVKPGRALQAGRTGTLVDMGGLVEHTTLTNIDARLAAPNGVAPKTHSFIAGQRIYRDFLSAALCFSRAADAKEVVTKSAIEVRWWVVIIISLILAILAGVATGNKLVISKQEFRLSTPSGREADRYVDDVLRKRECAEPHVSAEVIGVIQETENDHVGMAACKDARTLGRREGYSLS